jgi:hypothetical protein
MAWGESPSWVSDRWSGTRVDITLRVMDPSRVRGADRPCAGGTPGSITRSVMSTLLTLLREGRTVTDHNHTNREIISTPLPYFISMT